MLTFDVEPYSMVIPEMKAIYPEHWEELAFDKDIIELDPDYEAYNKMDKAGLIHVVTARFNNELVGYFIFCITFFFFLAFVPLRVFVAKQANVLHYALLILITITNYHSCVHSY